MNDVFVVGPLPPPVNGFAVITEALAKVWGASHQTVLLNTSPTRPRWARLCDFARFLKQGMKRKRSTLYLALSGGKRQWVDSLYLAFAAARGARLLIHHHSFAYLDRQTLSARFCMWLSRAGTHIVLCDCMRTLLEERYGLREGSAVALSNVAFVSPRDPVEVRPAGPLRVGYLSNITREKGIIDYFELLQLAQVRGLNLAGRVAGPVAPEIQVEFGRLLESSGAHHMGPVHGQAKDAFLRSIDVLVFPTRYVNEAEPVVIWEALSCGVPVIAYGRGCIAEMLEGVPGSLVVPAGDYETALQHLASLASNPDAFDRTRRLIEEVFTVKRAEALSTLNSLTAA